jgi:hypothetical protein
MLLPAALSRGTMLKSLGAAARLADADFLQILCTLVREMGAANGGRYVATLYCALPPPESRLSCLKEIVGMGRAEAFGEKEVLFLMEHFSATSPALIRKWVSNAGGGGGGAGAGAGGGRRFSVAPPRRRSAEKIFNPPGAPTGAESAASKFAAAGAAVLAGNRMKGRRSSKEGEPALQAQTPDEMIEIIADLVQKKVKANAEADSKQKPHKSIYKFVHDTLAQQYGMSSVSQFMRALRQFAIASDHVLQPRLHLFAQMLGLLEGESWTDSQADFYMLFLSHVLRCQPAGSVPRTSKDEASPGALNVAAAFARKASVMVDQRKQSKVVNRKQSMAIKTLPPPPSSADDPKAMVEYLCAANQSKETGTLLRDALTNPDTKVLLRAVGQAADMLIRSRDVRMALIDGLEEIADATAAGMPATSFAGIAEEDECDTFERASEVAASSVALDTLMARVMEAWEVEAGESDERHHSTLVGLFKEMDDDEDGLISLNEFRNIIEARAPEASIEDTMDKFEQCARLQPKARGAPARTARSETDASCSRIGRAGPWRLPPIRWVRRLR